MSLSFERIGNMRRERGDGVERNQEQSRMVGGQQPVEEEGEMWEPSSSRLWTLCNA